MGQMIQDQTSEGISVVPIHKFPDLLVQTADLINAQWPRSRTARLHSLQSSSDKLPTCFVATKNNNSLVIGHAKLTPVPGEPSSCFVESVVVAPCMRGQGIGSYLMKSVEEHGRDVGLEVVYLSTYDKQSFYARLGYEKCPPISIFGTRSYTIQNSTTKKTYMKKFL